MKVLLGEMTTIEAKEAFERTDLAIIPVGSTEVHGPHNPLLTDSNAVSELSRRIGEKMNGKAVVTPLIPFGFSAYHMSHHGTITLTEETLSTLLQEVAVSLQHWGIRRICVLNGHGGNQAALATAAAKLYEKGLLCAIPFWYDGAGQMNPRWDHNPDHGGFKETLVNMVTMPDAMRMDLYVPPNTGFQMTDKLRAEYIRLIQFKNTSIHVHFPTKPVWPHGFIEQGIASTEATKEEGEQMLEAVTQFYSEFLEEFLKAPLPPIE